LKKTFKLLILLLLTTLTSCDFGFNASDYDFDTHAEYYAPISKLKVFISAKGYVPKDQDLGDQNVAIIQTKIISDIKSDTLTINSSGQKIFSIFINKESQLLQDTSDYPQAIINALTKLQITDYSKEEIDELAEAILSISYGPKGHFLNGQTKLIRVDTVYYTTKYR